MTNKGVLMTSNGEACEPVTFQPAKQIYITSWHRSSSQDRVVNHNGKLDKCLISPIRTQPHGLSSFAYMIFSVDGSGTHSFRAKNSRFPSFKQYQHNLIIAHNNEIKLEWPVKQELTLICIGIDLEFLRRYIPTQESVFSDLFASFESKTPVMLSENHLSLTPKISSVLNELINCAKQGFCKHLYLEAKVIELLAHQFEQFEESLKKDLKSSIRKEDTEKMQRVRDILTNNLNNQLSLKQLAHEVGTNEYNLKKQFKQLFGHTVFGYLHTLKMEQSRQLIQNNEVKIAEVSEMMGYKHATHFTSAFKKFFGYSPNKIR